MTYATLSDNGQLSLSKSDLKKLNVKPGMSFIVFAVKDGFYTSQKNDLG